MPNHQEIVTKLSSVIPREVIYEIGTESMLSEIVHRLGEEALNLSVEELELARDEVRAALSDLDERAYVSQGLDAWEDEGTLLIS